MKKYLLFLAITVVFAVFTTACSNDDGPAEPGIPYPYENRKIR